MRIFKLCKVLLSFGLFFWVAPDLVAQSKDTTSILDWRRGIFPKEKPDELYDIKVNGFYRFFATHLYMPEPYILDENSQNLTLTKKNTLFIGDDSQLPNFLINVSGRPNKKVSWGFDIFMFQFLDGIISSNL